MLLAKTLVKTVKSDGQEYPYMCRTTDSYCTRLAIVNGVSPPHRGETVRNLVIFTAAEFTFLKKMYWGEIKIQFLSAASSKLQLLAFES